jgi:hypothetical protein
MRRSVTLFTLLAVCSVLAVAESWQGRLIDATCYEQNKSAATCDPTSSTTMFTLFVANRPYMLDATGNSKAAEAIKNRADRSSDPNKASSSQVVAKVTGTKDTGNTIKVDTVEIQ